MDRPAHAAQRPPRGLTIRDYSRRTETAYVAWVRRYIHFHGIRHPDELGNVEVLEFLSDLAGSGMRLLECLMDEEQEIREVFREAVSAASLHPGHEHAFPVGREFAESLGYPWSVLDDLPEVAVEAFAGVSNVSVLASFMEGATVLDLGCGAGLDSFVAARRVGPLGRVVGSDFCAAMLVRANRGVRTSGTRNIILARAAAEQLPLSDESIDVALVNGMFNLNPARTEIFEELARVVALGGVAYSAELILKEPLPQAIRADEASWFA